MRVVIGGDFNTVANIGERGMLLTQLVSGFRLKMVNENENEAPDDIWSFENCLGIRRGIDFIIASSELSWKLSGSIDDLQMGSDHRAVHGVLELLRKARIRYQKPKLPRGWRPTLQTNAEIIRGLRQVGPITSFDMMTSVLLKALPTEIRGVTRCRPWKSPEFLD